MKTFQIKDIVNNEVVAVRKTLNAAKAWNVKLNDGLKAPRYVVISTVVA
jgi:hypothetical protein